MMRTDSQTPQGALNRALAISFSFSLALLLGACSSSDDDLGARNGGDPDTDDPISQAAALGCERAASARDSGGLPAADAMFTWIEDLAGFGLRRSGSQALDQAEAYVRCQFEEMGLENVHLDEAVTWQWQADDVGLVVQGAEIDAFPVHHSFVTPGEPAVFSTGPDGLTRELVDIGDGSDFDPALVEDRLVLFDLRFEVSTLHLLLGADFLWDPQLTVMDDPQALLQANPYLTNIEGVLAALMDAGAAGFVGVLADYFDSNRYYNEFYRRLPFTLPGVWVGPREGAQIRELLGEDQAAAATLTLEGSRTETTARVVHGFLPGTRNDTIQVQSHHDAVWQGGVQDASGVAALLALAHYYAQQGPGEREKTLLFSSFSSHWTGYQLHQDFVRKYLEDNQTDYNLVANVTIEHIARHGVINRDSLELEVSDQPEPRGILNNVSLDLNRSIAEAIKRHDLHRTALMGTEDIGMPTDASFVYQAGLPTISLISGPVYLYDEVDTPAMVARDQLQPVARVFMDIIDALDATAPGDMARGSTMDDYQFGEFDQEMAGQKAAVISALPEDWILQLLQ